MHVQHFRLIGSEPGDAFLHVAAGFATRTLKSRYCILQVAD
jgi:hypothetical protein